MLTREEKLAKKREHYKNNKDVYKKRRKQYYKNNKDKQQSQMKLYYKLNKEEINRYNRSKWPEYYALNKDREKKRQREYNIRAGRITGTEQSVPEKIIEKYLIENNIKYEKEKWFENCKNDKDNTLLFDFYLPEKKICIEYDGIHHYKPIYGEEKLKRQIKHDNIKTKYCKNENIKLIRIPYDKNIIYMLESI